MSKIVYSSNNSGGDWWLTDRNWLDLEAAGWVVQWFAGDEDDTFRMLDDEGRWLGALATYASREGLSMGDAIDEWERVTGECSSELGCSCCGTPHSFYEETDDGRIGEYWSPSYPTQGDSYR